MKSFEMLRCFVDIAVKINLCTVLKEVSPVGLNWDNWYIILKSLIRQNENTVESTNIARAFIQWAGFTFGRTVSFTDHEGSIGDSGMRSLHQTQNQSDTGANGTNQIAYTWALGNGVTLNVGADERRVKSIANCAACHQAEGTGVEGVYPPLAGSPFVNGPPEAMARILLHGLNGPLTVHGKTYNGEMPAWQQLPDEQLAAVMTYVRASFGNKAPPVGADTVAAVRKETADRAKPWTAAELASVAAAK